MANRGMTVLITGASGSIGSKLSKHFAERGEFDLRLFDLKASGDPQLRVDDLTEYDERWAQHFAGVDAVIHLAGTSSMMAPWGVVQHLSIDLSLNVLRAAEIYHSRRVIFASSNWVMAGYRFGVERLTPELPPWPTNPYGAAKLFIERAGRDWAHRTGGSFIALRIGHCQHVAGNVPGPHMQNGTWGQQMWVSDRDLCDAMECAVRVEDVPFAILNLMSANPGMRWDIEDTRRILGYAPFDGHSATSTPEIEEGERLARLGCEITKRLKQISAKW